MTKEAAELHYNGKPVSEMTREELIEALTLAVRMMEKMQAETRRYRDAVKRWGI